MQLKNILGLLLIVFLAAGGCSSKRTAGTDPVGPDEIDSASLSAAKAFRAGELLKSLELYKGLSEADPTNPVYLNNMGVILLKGGRTQEALDAFESASLLRPNNSDYLANVGFVQLKLGDYDDAVSFFDRALQLAPRNASALYGKGVAYLYMNEPEAALGLFRQSIIVDPDNHESLFMKAFASQKNRLWLEALNEYSAYIEVSADRLQKANAFSNRALCYFQLKDYKKGIADLGKAMELDDSNAVFYYNRAQGYQARQDYENAVKDYTRAISRKASFPEAYINRGELNYLLGMEAKGCADLQRACALGYCGPVKKYESAGKCKN